MGDFLDDYLDGLSSGMQRFDPLPTGPYHGTKQKRQWHLLADSEREQAIFEARMREEEESASASAEGASAEGGSAPIPEKLILDRRFVPDVVPDVPSLLTAANAPVQYSNETTTETFGYLDIQADIYAPLQNSSSGQIASVTVVENIDEDPQYNQIKDAPLVVYDSYGIQPAPMPSHIETLSQTWTDGTWSKLWIQGTYTSGELISIEFDSNGTGYPYIWIGGDLVVVFRHLFSPAQLDENSNAWIYIYQSGTPSWPEYFTAVAPAMDPFYNTNTGEPQDTVGMFILDIAINAGATPQEILDALENGYQAQPAGEKYWSYGVISIAGITIDDDPID